MARALRVGLALVARREWRGQANLPLTGPALIVANHLSSLDPAFVGEFIAYSGRWPYFLAKDSLFRWPVIGFFVRRSGMIPVHRGTDHVADALDEAQRYLDEGHVVVLYPEGTTARDPLLWPCRPRTGAARLALATGLPVIPLGQWGVSTICPDNAGPQRTPHLLPRHDVVLELGEPVTTLRGDPSDPADVEAAGEVIMAAVTAIVERLRGEPMPAGRWDPKRHERVVPVPGPR